jgi:endo-1,4-beta-D-glucanase Y
MTARIAPQVISATLVLLSLEACDAGQRSASPESNDADGASGMLGWPSGSGGATADGAVSTGGGPPGEEAPDLPRPSPGANGFIASNLTLSDATRAFDAFRQKYVIDCGGGRIRVASNGDETVSEGIAYGMLLAVAHGDRVLFDGLWSYYRDHTNEHGVMHWKANACTGEIWGQNGASDAELDAAMALVEAECAWGGYAADLTALLDSIRTYEVANLGTMRVLKPGDAWGGQGCTNPSYFAPAYYRVFARIDASHAAAWTDLAGGSYAILGRAQNPSSGLVPDWTDENGAPGGSGNGCPLSSNYAYDAARVPWRVATDYLWWGVPEAKAFLDRMTNWVSGPAGGIRSVGDGYDLSGNRTSNNHNSTFVGAFALGAMAHSQAKADEFMQELVSMNRDNQYFQETLRAVYLAFAAGMIGPGCS